MSGKHMTVDLQERNTHKSGVRSAMHAASQLPEGCPSGVDNLNLNFKDALIPAHCPMVSIYGR